LVKLQIINSLGWLNVGNPLKPEHDYELKLNHQDHRSMLKFIMGLGSSEPGSHLKDMANTDVHLTDLYGNGGLVNTESDKYIHLGFSETTTTDRPDFKLRATHMDKFLIGSKPDFTINKARIFKIVKLYEELVKEVSEQSRAEWATSNTKLNNVIFRSAQNKITGGPIDHQYTQMIKLR